VLEDIRDDNRIHVPSGSARVAWVDTRDVGEAGARALLDPGSRGAAWTLTGAEARSFSEVAHLLTDVLGRTITYEAASIPGYVWHLTRRRGRGWGRALVQTVLHVALRFGIEARVDPTLASVLGRRPRSIAETIADHRHLWSQ
jgi:nucleoside-diphosphate-sugar epimerase